MMWQNFVNCNDWEILEARKQCTQIWQFSKDLGNKFSEKEAKIFTNFLGYFEKCHF